MPGEIKRMREKVRRRIDDVPENVKAAVTEVRTESVVTAAGNVPKRFGKSNRKLIE